MLTIIEAREILRLDNEDNDFIIQGLLNAMPDYLYHTTGYIENIGPDDPYINGLARTVCVFLLRLWYNPDGADSEKLQRTIDTMLTPLQAACRSADNG